MLLGSVVKDVDYGGLFTPFNSSYNFSWNILVNNFCQNGLIPKEHAEPSRTSNMNVFSKIVNGFQLLTIFPKSSVLDV